jgi:uncharacterized protein (DUF2141 family)
MKKIFVLVIAVIGIAMTSQSQTQEDKRDTLRVVITSFSTDEGQAVVMLFRKEDAVPKSPWMKATGTIRDGKSSVVFAGIPYGKYTAIVFQDVNSNGILDHSWIGLPKEPLGFSNGWKLRIYSGMPSFSKLNFEFTCQRRECAIGME